MQPYTPPSTEIPLSPLPLAIASTTRVSEALARMEREAVGHLVVDDGTAPFVVSKAELAVAIRLDRDVAIGEMADKRAVIVSRDARPHRVLASMRESRASAALAVDGDRVVGILTTTDVIRWLELTLGSDALPTPEQIRARILGEHTRIRVELDHIEALASRVIRGSFEGASLRERVRVLEGVLRAHLELEERIVLPWLREVSGFGAERARNMEAEHAEQRATLDGIIEGLFTTRSATDLAVRTIELCRALREDIANEEQSFLAEDGPLYGLVNADFGG